FSGLWLVEWGLTMFSDSQCLWYLSSTIRYFPKASQIPSLDPSMGICSSLS
ncbi:hypothetical protein HETIRDRAFT_312129, partial [Heterobasidion irregulare TC 32-1]